MVLIWFFHFLAPWLRSKPQPTDACSPNAAARTSFWFSEFSSVSVGMAIWYRCQHNVNLRLWPWRLMPGALRLELCIQQWVRSRSFHGNLTGVFRFLTVALWTWHWTLIQISSRFQPAGDLWFISFSVPLFHIKPEILKCCWFDFLRCPHETRRRRRLMLRLQSCRHRS